MESIGDTTVLTELQKAKRWVRDEMPEGTWVPATERQREIFKAMMTEWAISGKPLKDYQPPAVSEVQPVEPEADRDRAEMKFRSKLAVKGLLREHREETAAAIEQSIDTEGPNVSSTADVRQEIAAAIRKEYEAVQPDTKITVVARKDGKVDVSKLDPRTGQVAAYELQIMDDGSLHISYRFKS